MGLDGVGHRDRGLDEGAQVEAEKFVAVPWGSRVVIVDLRRCGDAGQQGCEQENVFSHEEVCWMLVCECVNI